MSLGPEALGGAALVLLGGFLGGTLRFLVSGVLARSVGEVFPWGTLVVNVTGAFVAGMVAGTAQQMGGVFDALAFRDFVLVGFLGGYTTVSSFSLQTLALALDGEAAQAIMNVALSAGLCVLAVALGVLTALQVLT